VGLVKRYEREGEVMEQVEEWAVADFSGDHPRYTFTDTEGRDSWIDRHYPVRECGDVPGWYDLPDGSGLGVRELEVTVYRGSE
jgi:hypothetical protein